MCIRGFAQSDRVAASRDNAPVTRPSMAPVTGAVPTTKYVLATVRPEGLAATWAHQAFGLHAVVLGYPLGQWLEA